MRAMAIVRLASRWSYLHHLSRVRFSSGCSETQSAESLRSELPPWRQPKPWRWVSDTDEAPSFWFLQLPDVQQDDEKGSGPLVVVGVVGVVLFFSFGWWRPPGGDLSQSGFHVGEQK
mmetsp:Transcript_67740/g.105843  ORF Transcript_67740/g.105843 Transcript_67740/m.105843 type:complete len:117 (+) Transcript_67740:27-377(+)